MSLIILEGLDRVGKSSMAEHYKTLGFEVVHQSAPPKGQTADLYLEEQMQLVSRAANKDIVLDRSYYGEAVWPKIYGRTSLLSEEGIEVLRELEESVGTTRILMWDTDIEGHWARCVANKEPLTRAQFLSARKLFNDLGEQYGFERTNWQEFRTQTQANSVDRPAKSPKPAEAPASNNKHQNSSTLSVEQEKLEMANAINDVLSKSNILKIKGPMYQKLDAQVRQFLHNELAKIFGNAPASPTGFSKEEVELLKFFAGKLKEGKR